VAQQGPPPRRHARPPAPEWAEQPPAQDEADWQAQNPGSAEQQGQIGWDGQQPPQDWTARPGQTAGPGQGGWSPPQPPAGWQEQAAHGSDWAEQGTPAAPGGWAEQAQAPDWRGQPSQGPHADWQGQPPSAEWPGGQAPAAGPGWDAPAGAHAYGHQQAPEPGWNAPADHTAARHAAQSGWDTPASRSTPEAGWDQLAPNPAADPNWGPPAAAPPSGAAWAEPPAQTAHAAAPLAHAALPQTGPSGWADQAPQAAHTGGALDLADGDRIAWPEEPGPAPAEAGQAWRNVPVRRPGDLEDPDADELPPWAGLSIMPQRPARQGRTIYPQRGGGAADGNEPVPEPAGLTRRAIATRARKARRKLIIGGICAIVAVCIGAIVWLFVKPSPPAAVNPGFVQTFQPGEMQSVPDACQVVTGTVLSQYMPGQPSRVHSASLNGKTSSQCTWTLDAKPVYRVLEVTNQAYAPSGLNPGNGSATSGAILAYSEAEQQLAHPAKSTHLPAAVVSKMPGLGDAAFSAVQVIRRAGTVNDLVTLVIRDRNVLVTVALQGEQRAAAGGYGPVRLSELQAGTVAAARQALAALPQR
jgi:hypothetical protein